MKASRFLHPLVAVLAGISAGSRDAAAQIHVTIAADTQIVDSFRQWTASTPWSSITRYSGPYVNRPTLDLVLQLQALKAGGLDFSFDLLSTPNYERSKLEVVHGNADLSAETIWDDEIRPYSDALDKTGEVIRDGEFEKGIYTLPSNSKLLSITTFEELRHYVCVTVGAWKTDLKTIDSMHLKGVEKAPSIENVFQMIQKGRADFTFTEFSANPDLGVEVNGIRLIPVPNCKVALAGGRSWVVNKNSPHAGELLAALQKGLQSLRQDGTITRALSESGFLNSKVAGWNRLY